MTTAGPADLAACLMRPLGARWRHVEAVAARAGELTATVDPGDGQLLVDAAWLHDIGYAPEVVATGLHPLDGARFLAARRYPDRLVRLVAHHSGAVYEAEERGLAEELAVFEREDGPVLDALVCADMTTGPAGETYSFDERIQEILRRYPPGSPVHRAISRARDELAGCVERTLARLAQPT